MKLTGDADGLEELKTIKESNLFYLKYLLKEAQTSTYRNVEFKGRDGKAKFKITYFPDRDEFKVDKIGEGTGS